MKQKKQIIILHIDGLAYHRAQEAIREGDMPFLKELIANRGYELLEYRSGIPSTTPYIQAGLMYGENAEIPAFRWFDRQKYRVVQLMGVRTFYEVSDKYFHKEAPLLAGGATISALYAGGASAPFVVSYVDKDVSQWTNSLTRKVLLHLLLDPQHHLKWMWHSLKRSIKIGWQSLRFFIKRRYVDWIHFPLYLLDQLFLYYPSSIALRYAIQDGYPIIYAGFYSYDNVAHIFGHRTMHGTSLLRDIDETVRQVVESINEGTKYELIILSDHGETQFVSMKRKTGKTFAQHLATMLPRYKILEYPGKTIRAFLPSDGKIILAYSGGLAHLYDAASNMRLSYRQIEDKFPGLLLNMVQLPEIACAMVRDGTDDLLFYDHKKISLSRPLDKQTKAFLSQFDKPEFVVRQLRTLNSFKNTGDVVLITRFEGDTQISFEPPVCGHGSIGGHQARPFILLRKDLHLDTSTITDAKDLYPFLMSLKKGAEPGKTKR